MEKNYSIGRVLFQGGVRGPLTPFPSLDVTTEGGGPSSDKSDFTRHFAVAVASQITNSCSGPQKGPISENIFVKVPAIQSVERIQVPMRRNTLKKQ